MDTMKPDSAASETCPLCAFWTAYKKSDVARHVEGIQRETLLLARSLLETAIRATEDQVATERSSAPPPAGPVTEKL